MKKIIIILIVWVGLLSSVRAQISHGGNPLPFTLTKSDAGSFYEEMPAFDVTEELRIDSLNESDLRSGFRFAYKFMTDFSRSNAGVSFILPDGTRVWRMGIRSKGALSINVLFTEYELPEGARLFLYNSDQSHILGAFNHLNNSDLGVLPVAPVYGAELIIEYQEPANVAFPGRLKIGEVNHAYRDLRAKEPSDTKATFDCMPPALCFSDTKDEIGRMARSVVLIIINGTTGCTGVLLNNTSGDKAPYLLTASHCLNNNFRINNPDYAQIAGTIVSFFNYESPLCAKTTSSDGSSSYHPIRGSEEMSMASAYFHAANEEHDMALLELAEAPPAYYHPYYAGWNATGGTSSAYFNIHHPGASVKRFGDYIGKAVLTTYEASVYTFADEAHWEVGPWLTGSTSNGSSGSPLFDIEGRVIGGLSGGESSCYNRDGKDYFFALSKAWTADSSPNRQLKHWLNPGTQSQLTCSGLDPYAGVEAYRLSNVRSGGYTEQATVATVSGSTVIPLFGNNGNGAVEYGEVYRVSENAWIDGAYFVTSATGTTNNMEVEVSVYSGVSKPETLLHTETFRPMYTNFTTSDGGTFVDTVKALNRKQESYIHFSESIQVRGQFFVTYRIVSAPGDTYFSAYSLPKTVSAKNTTWVKNATSGWKEASLYTGISYATSLYIDPVVRYTGNVGNEDAERVLPVRILSDPKNHTLQIILPNGIEKGECQLFSADGRMIRHIRLDETYTSLSMPTFAAGLYVIKVLFEGNSHTQKLVF